MKMNDLYNLLYYILLYIFNYNKNKVKKCKMMLSGIEPEFLLQIFLYNFNYLRITIRRSPTEL